MSKKPDDAARIASLANIMKSANQQKDVSPSPAPPVVSGGTPTPPAPSAGKQSKKRAAGKRSDKNRHLYGLLLFRETHKRARRRLEDTMPEWDMSDLVEDLLQQWLKSK